MDLYGYSPVLDMLDTEEGDGHDPYTCECADCKDWWRQEMAERTYEVRRGN